MNLLKSLFLFMVFVMYIATPDVEAAASLVVGKGDMIFRDEKGNPDKPITVWYFRPSDILPTSKVVFVMHGVRRNGRDYRDHWAKYAEKYKFLLIVPEFSEKYYSRDEYQFGNVTEPNMEKWSFSVIEHLFDFLKTNVPLTTDSYALYGHSAGAQFVHRYMLFMPAPRVSTAISANAGSYTLPIYPSWIQHRFPWSLDKAMVDENRLRSVFSKNVVVLLGEKDTDANHKHLPKSGPAMEQGVNRLERGKYFYQTAKQQAATLNAPFKWVLKTVPGVGHSDSGMAEAAVAQLLADDASVGNPSR